MSLRYLLFVSAFVVSANTVHADQKPLKVFVLVGQSNMQGHAHVRTLEHIGMDPRTRPLLQEIQNDDGTPRVCDDVWISYLSSGGEKHGPLTTGFGADGNKIGPELMFGISMQKTLNEPILIIKTAWGGKSLHTDFRPPSAGPYEFNQAQIEQLNKQGKDIAAVKAEKAKATGYYYRLTIDHVKKVLANIKDVYPDYNPQRGHKLAGFVWFQGWNDMVDRSVYPSRDMPGGYDLYSEVLAHFMRDVRKDLSAPDLPFVIGVMGVGGPVEKYRPDQQRYAGIHQNFRNAMAAPAAQPEFKDNVATVLTENYWDMELVDLRARSAMVKQQVKQLQSERELSREELKAVQEELLEKEFTKRQRDILQKGISNFEFHYLGCAKIMVQIGKGFAEAIGEITGEKKKISKTTDQKTSSVAPTSFRGSLASAGPHPNVLFLAIDDLNDWVGALGGHPQAKTPNLDRLISQSVLFRNAHCAAPVCSASRHALLSGLRPSTTGWYSNSSKDKKSYERALGETVPMPTHFKHNGYRTMAAGKIFHKGTSDVKDYDYWDAARPKYKWPKELAARGHGYQGNSGGHFHPFPPDGGAIYQKYQRGVDGQSLCWGALEKADMPPEGMPDEQIAAWAVERLKQEHSKPFFLAIGFVRPHLPYTAPKEFFELYPAGDIVMPQVPTDEMDDIPLWGKALAYGTIDGGDHRAVLEVGPDYWKEMVRAYLACVSFVDAQAGKVLRALEASPYADNTIVVFWSDHGQHLGEKRHWRKMALWEESTRVPLAIRLPKSAHGGRSCDSPVSLIDIYPTLLDLCNLPYVKGLEGISLMPQLEDPPARRIEPAITTWQYNNHAARSLNFRYIRYRDGTEELYDHRSDPNEHNNLAGDPKLASIKKKLGAYMPTENVVPKSIKDGGTDSYGRKYERLSSEGVPDWLGKVPERTSVDAR